MDKILIDTHILIWLDTNDTKLSSHFKKQINSAKTIYVSLATLFELATLIRLNRIQISMPYSSYIRGIRSRYKILPYKDLHLEAFSNIIPVKNHRDPIDLMLIAQSKAENIPLMSADSLIAEYFK